MRAIRRCSWCGTDDLYTQYHDTEWGVPLHSDERLFEFLVLEGFQAGLSWITILKKRDAFRRAFCGFDAEKIVSFDQAYLASLLNDPTIVRNRAKINAAVVNARCYLDLRDRLGSFDQYVWQFTDGKTICNHWKSEKQVPAKTLQSETLSRDLRQRGFKFVGATICYAFMQAVGLVNDHITDCFRHGELQQN